MIDVLNVRRHLHTGRGNCADLYGVVDHETIVAMARLVNALICVGNEPPVVQRIAVWCRAIPQPGDLVVEVSSREESADRVGLFVKSETLRVCHHELHDVSLAICGECDADDRWEEHLTWILVQREPLRTSRWHNARFLRLPINSRQVAEAEQRSSTSVFTRDSLIDILADSGIEIKR